MSWLSNRIKKSPEAQGWPTYLLGGRVRTSTVGLIVAFFAAYWLHATYAPPPTPPPVVVPPGFVPDPAYTWVPRTNVTNYPTTTYRPTPTRTSTETTETTPTTETTTTPSTPTSPTSPTSTTGPSAPPTTTVITPAPGILPPITLPVLPGLAPPPPPSPSLPPPGTVVTTAVPQAG